MTYDIRCKNDFLTGTSLHVTVPEEDVDQKALNTIESDRPEFILPFRHISIDGLVEFIYQVGMHSRLQYLAGKRSPQEYCALWTAVLSPMLNCGDWFMKADSFVLRADQLYCDKKSGSICYIYIPVIKELSGYITLKEMVAEMTKFITVTDAGLENKVLRAVMKDFDPCGFLQMLNSYITTNAPVVSDFSSVPQAAYAQRLWTTPPADVGGTVQQAIQKNEKHPQHEHAPIKKAISADESSGDIVINLPHDRKSAKKAALTKKETEGTDAKKDKEPKKQKNNGGLLGRNKDVWHEVQGVAASPTPVPEPTAPVALDFTAQPERIDITQSLSEILEVSGFRLVGSVLLPPFIDVRIGHGDIFTIGRFDTSAGRQLSTFEFEKKTKAVSRRHAAIELDANGYNIVDLASTAGTFINGHRMPPNTPCELKSGCRVSFGNAGADYVWEG